MLPRTIEVEGCRSILCSLSVARRCFFEAEEPYPLVALVTDVENVSPGRSLYSLQTAGVSDPHPHDPLATPQT